MGSRHLTPSPQTIVATPICTWFSHARPVRGALGVAVALLAMPSQRCARAQRTYPRRRSCSWRRRGVCMGGDADSQTKMDGGN